MSGAVTGNAHIAVVPRLTQQDLLQAPTACFVAVARAAALRSAVLLVADLLRLPSGLTTWDSGLPPPVLSGGRNKRQKRGKKSNMDDIHYQWRVLGDGVWNRHKQRTLH